MFMYHHHLLPECFDNLFITNNQVHNYNNRAAANYRSHACRTSIKQLTILHPGPNLWNSFLSSITVINTISSFKKLFDFLFDLLLEN